MRRMRGEQLLTRHGRVVVRQRAWTAGENVVVSFFSQHLPVTQLACGRWPLCPLSCATGPPLKPGGRIHAHLFAFSIADTTCFAGMRAQLMMPSLALSARFAAVLPNHAAALVATEHGRDVDCGVALAVHAARVSAE